jgi:hypothetical protein
MSNDVLENMDKKSVKEDVKDLNEKVNSILKHLQDSDMKRVKTKEFKLPFGIKGRLKKAIKDGKFLVIFLRNNHKIEFKFVKEVGGLIEIDKYRLHLYDNDAVYHWKKDPVLVIFEWRLSPVGSTIDEVHSRLIDKNIDPDEYRARLIGTTKDEEIASVLKDHTYGVQTVVRAIEKAELDKNDKKKGGFGAVIWIVVGGVAIYVILKILKLI